MATFIFCHCRSFFLLFFEKKRASIHLRASGLTKEKLRALQANRLPPHFSDWLALFVSNKTMRACSKRLRWERGGASPLPSPSQGRTDCPLPAQNDVSIRNITPRVRCELTHYNSGIHKEVASGLRENYHIAFDAHQAKMSDLALGGPLHKTSARQGHNVFCSTSSESIGIGIFYYMYYITFSKF